jgi:uncharacterized membrane protein
VSGEPLPMSDEPRRPNDDPARTSDDPLRFHRGHEQVHAAFGTDRFGQVAERVARLFGTPQYIVGQTILVIIWIAVNAAAVALRWDAYPFILLNLAFSTQAAYAAPLILLAQTRQADRDKAQEMAAALHSEDLARRLQHMVEENTALTQQVDDLAKQIEELTRAIHAQIVKG